MAPTKLLLFALFLTSVFIKSVSDSDGVQHFAADSESLDEASENTLKVEAFDSGGVNDATSRTQADYGPLKTELDQLKSKIALLESSTDEKTRELKSKDESIKKMEIVIEEKSAKLAKLQGEVRTIQETASEHAKDLMYNAHAQAGELEKQVDILGKEVETQNKKKDALEARAIAAEKTIQELNEKLENLERIGNEQKSRIRKTERALRVAEEEIMKSKLEATHNSKELREVQEAWLPPWLASHLLHFQFNVVNQWNKHGRPVMGLTVQKAWEKKAQAENWAKPHIDTFKTKWIPHVKGHCSAFIANIEPNVRLLTAKTVRAYHKSKKFVEPHADTFITKWIPHFKGHCSALIANIEPNVRLITAKTVRAYHTSKKSVEPHVVKVQRMVEPYYQDARKFTKPYIDQAWGSTKPHVDKASVVLKPYKKKFLRSYKRFLRSVTKYHQQGQATINQMLKSNELTKSLATHQFVWFLTSALMTMPVLYLIQMAFSFVCKKPRKKHSRNSHTSHARRRAKRNHSDNQRSETVPTTKNTKYVRDPESTRG